MTTHSSRDNLQGSEENSSAHSDQDKSNEAQASIDQLAERLKATETVSEDTAEFIARNWKNVLGGVLLLMALVWLIGQYRTGEQEKLGRASLLYMAVQREMAALLEDESQATAVEGEDAKKIEEDRENRIKENLKLLDDNYKGTKYGELGSLYRARLLLKEKKFDEARGLLQTFSINEFFNVKTTKASEKLNADNFTSEVAALMYARSFADEASAGNREKARTLLISLAKGSSFVCAEAVVALLRLSEGNEELKAAQEIAHEISIARPELSSVIDEELSNYPDLRKEQNS